MRSEYHAPPGETIQFYPDVDYATIERRLTHRTPRNFAELYGGRKHRARKRRHGVQWWRGFQAGMFWGFIGGVVGVVAGIWWGVSV